MAADASAAPIQFPPGSWAEQSNARQGGFKASTNIEIRRVLDLINKTAESDVKKYISENVNTDVFNQQYFRESVKASYDGTRVTVQSYEPSLLAALLVIYGKARTPPVGYPSFIEGMLASLESSTASAGSSAMDADDVPVPSAPERRGEFQFRPVDTPPANPPTSSARPKTPSMPAAEDSPPAPLSGSGGRGTKRTVDDPDDVGNAMRQATEENMKALRELATQATDAVPKAMEAVEEARVEKAKATQAAGRTRRNITLAKQTGAPATVTGPLEATLKKQEQAARHATAVHEQSEATREQVAEVAQATREALARAEESERLLEIERIRVAESVESERRLKRELDAAIAQSRERATELSNLLEEARRKGQTDSALRGQLEAATLAAEERERDIRQLREQQRLASKRTEELEERAAADLAKHQAEARILREELERANREIDEALAAPRPAPPPVIPRPTQQMVEMVLWRRKNMAAQSVNLVAEMRQRLDMYQQQLEATGPDAGTASVLEAMERLGLEEKVDSLRKGFFYQMVANVEVEEFEYAKNLTRAWLYFEVDVASVLYWAARLQSDIEAIILKLKSTNKKGSMGIVESFFAQSPDIERPSGAGALFDEYQRITKVNLARINKN